MSTAKNKFAKVFTAIVVTAFLVVVSLCVVGIQIHNKNQKKTLQAIASMATGILQGNYITFDSLEVQSKVEEGRERSSVIILVNAKHPLLKEARVVRCTLKETQGSYGGVWTASNMSIDYPKAWKTSSITNLYK